MAFLASLEPSHVIGAYMVSKLAGGLCAILVALLMTPAEEDLSL